MSAKYYVDANGKYLGAFGDGAKAPPGAIERNAPPRDGRQIWDTNASAWRDSSELLLDYASNLRLEKEIGGVEIGGMVVATDDRSKALINGAFNMVTTDPSIVLKFKVASGFVDLDAAAVTAIAMAVGAHVQSCFAKEAEAHEAIDNGTITSKEQIDTLFSASPQQAEPQLAKKTATKGRKSS